MLAHHPVTGQPIHILRTETQIFTDCKTLVWVRNNFQKSHRWKRWNCVITEPDAYQLCEKVVAIVLDKHSNLEDWLPILLKADCLIVAPNSVVLSLDKIQGIPQPLVYEDLLESYPYLGESLTENDSLEKVILSLAHILRMNHIAWTYTGDRELMSFPVKMQYDAWRKACGKSIQTLAEQSDDSCIPQTWLFQQYFRHSSNRRSREIFSCLEKNIASPFIDRIVLLNEQEYAEIPVHSKIQTIAISHRLTYYDALIHAKQIAPAGSFVILANADIYFGETLSYLWNVSLAERRLFLALLRWEDAKNGEQPSIYGPRADSQDSWIFSRNSLDFDITEEDFGFPFGKSCCDNAFSLIMMRKRCVVVNPAFSIKTFHVHASNVRSHDPKDVLYRKHYLYIDPSAIQTCNVDKNIQEFGGILAWKKRILGKSFTRSIMGNESDVKTFFAMMKRSEHSIYHFSNGNNLWTPSPNGPPLYKFENCFVTMEGLISTFQSIVVGNHRNWIHGWEASTQSSLTPSIHVPNLIAYPYDTSKSRSLSQWVLSYLPNVYMLRTMIKNAGFPTPEFLVPQISEIGSFLQDCEWFESANITVIPMMENMNYYANNVWAVGPLDGEWHVTKEDVALLRSIMPANDVPQKGPVAVFCVEDSADSVLSREWAEETAERILPKGWIVHYVSGTDLPSVRRKAFQSAAWIFGKGDALDWLWYANPGATVMEFMHDSECSGEHVHLAGASDLRYIVSLIKKEPLPYQKQTAMMEVGKAIKKYGFKEVLESIRSNTIVETPKIIVPSGKALTGLWSHVGDSLREMVSIWNSRKYVVLEKSENTPYCWWGGIGEVLLYDWPTSRWWIDIPPYQMALFGNCAPPGPDKHKLRQSTWCYWPKSPKLVEEIVADKENMKGYRERSIASVFLGKIENGVQRDHRTKHDWSSCIELFSMPVDTTGIEYPFTKKEYLLKLCNSRFGLCLPGLGPKCNREIECFAAGCVPIVTEGVDMTNYLLSPKEGVHYLKARSPEDVLRIVKETSPEKWLEMSIAGKEWWLAVASAEGMFRLTWARIEQCRPYLNVGIPQSFQGV